MFTDLGYSKKSVVWKLGRTVASNSRSISSSNISKPTITGPSSLAVKEKFFDSVKFIPGNVKTFIFFINKSISYLLFRVYSSDELMTKAATTMAAARMERSETGHQFIIPRPREYSWGH